MSFYFHCSHRKAIERLPPFLFSNSLYFVYDLFLSITCEISMHSTLRVITSHPVSSPWLHLSSLYLFSMWYFPSHLLLVVPIWSLCWAPVFLSSSLSLAHTHIWGIIHSRYYFNVLIFMKSSPLFNTSNFKYVHLVIIYYINTCFHVVYLYMLSTDW